jgi:hypothetical protein
VRRTKEREIQREIAAGFPFVFVPNHGTLPHLPPAAGRGSGSRNLLAFLIWKPIQEMGPQILRGIWGPAIRGKWDPEPRTGTHLDETTKRNYEEELRRVLWGKEASGLGCVTPYWSCPARIKLICYRIISTMMEAIIG